MGKEEKNKVLLFDLNQEEQKQMEKINWARFVYIWTKDPNSILLDSGYDSIIEGSKKVGFPEDFAVLLLHFLKTEKNSYLFKLKSLYYNLVEWFLYVSTIYMYLESIEGVEEMKIEKVQNIEKIKMDWKNKVREQKLLLIEGGVGVGISKRVLFELLKYRND